MVWLGGSVYARLPSVPPLRRRPWSLALPPSPLTPLQTIIAGGLAVGVLDILKPIIFSLARGGSAQRVLQSVASGALGREAYQGGLSTALLGLGFHFFIAFSVFATYYAVSRKLRPLVTHALILGPLYGIAVYFFMQFVVFPLSAIGSVKHPPAVLFDGILTHILCVGLPVGLVIHEAARRERTKEIVH
jgi:hypothetical protein